MHNKEYALKLVQRKMNGENNYSYSQIGEMTGYSKLQIINFSKLLNEKDIYSILVHGLTNKPSNNSVPDKEIEFIKNFKNKYPTISISQFMDIYHEDIIFNRNMKKIVEENNLKPRSYSFYEGLYKKFKWPTPIKHKSFDISYTPHPLREPSPKRGILVMIDGTPHDWFCNGNKASLHLAIDDATGEILCGWFMPTECLEGYTMLLYLLLKEHGIPENIYSDRHSILINHLTGELTQFGHMCNDLGINQIAALSAEAKGKIERMNFTLQNRLLNDIKRFEIKTYKELNEWFNSYYKNYINKKFAYEPEENDDAFVKLEKNQNLNYILCTRNERTILDGCVISYNRHYYKIITDDNELKPIYKGTKIIVYENILNKKIFVKYYNKFYNTKMIPDKVTTSEKARISRIENQKELEQVLIERNKEIKTRKNEMSSS